MSKCEGMLYTCTRCGATEFVKLIDERYLDGGYTPHREYEKPEGWLRENEMGDLCPNCADVFKLFVTNFMGGNVAPAWKYEGPMEG